MSGVTGGGVEQAGETDLLAELRRLLSEGRCLCSSAHTDWQGVEAWLDRLESADAVTEWGVRGVLPEPDPETVWQYPREIAARLTAKHPTYGGTVVSRQRTTLTTDWKPTPGAPQ